MAHHDSEVLHDAASSALLRHAIPALAACRVQPDPSSDEGQTANAIAIISTGTKDIADDGLAAVDGAINDSESVNSAGNAPGNAD